MKAWLRRAARHAAEDNETDWRFTVVTSLAYAALLAFCHAHHELWRDEIHAWSVARLAGGFGDLVTGDRIYEGHPPGWFWYLRLWTYLTERPWGLHVATVVAATGAAVLFARFAPVPRYLKVLLLCSYLFGFEYTVMSRNYVLGWFFVTVACSLFHPLKSRPILLSLALGMLALTSAYGAIVAVCLYPVLLRASYSVEFRRGGFPLHVVATRRLSAGAALFAALLVFSYVSTIPPDPNPFAGEWDFSYLRAREVIPSLERLLYAVLPVRSFVGTGAWQDFAVFWIEHDTLRLVACLVVPVLLCLALAPAWEHAGCLVLGVGLMNIVQIARYFGSVRHWGHAVILFVALYWVSRTARPRVANGVAIGVFLLMGAFQVESFAAIVKKDRKLAFSGGKETADYVERAGLRALPLVAGPDYFIVTVTGYLRRTYVSSETEEINETVVFHGRRRPFTSAGLVARAVKEARHSGGPVLVLSNAELPPPGRKMTMTLLFTSSARNLADNERYFLYRLSP